MQGLSLLGIEIQVILFKVEIQSFYGRVEIQVGARTKSALLCSYIHIHTYTYTYTCTCTLLWSSQSNAVKVTLCMSVIGRCVAVRLRRCFRVAAC